MKTQKGDKTYTLGRTKKIRKHGKTAELGLGELSMKKWQGRRSNKVGFPEPHLPSLENRLLFPPGMRKMSLYRGFFSCFQEETWVGDGVSLPGATFQTTKLQIISVPNRHTRGRHLLLPLGVPTRQAPSRVPACPFDNTLPTGSFWIPSLTQMPWACSRPLEEASHHTRADL